MLASIGRPKLYSTVEIVAAARPIEAATFRPGLAAMMSFQDQFKRKMKGRKNKTLTE
jgi:hypothetical protein